jgi:hypothetical protein
MAKCVHSHSKIEELWGELTDLIDMHRSKHKTSVPTLIKYWDDRPEWGYSVVHPCGSDAILDEETWSIRNKNPRKAVIDYLTALYMHTLEVMATMAPRAYLGMLDIQCLITGKPTLPNVANPLTDILSTYFALETRSRSVATGRYSRVETSSYLG